MFSVSTIYSARDFLILVKDNQLLTSEFLNSFKNYKYDSSVKILQLVTECGWVHLEIDGKISLSEKGEGIAALDYKSALTRQLEDMILIYNPSWASFLPKGRDETIRFLPDGPKQCFKEAGFTGDLSDQLIDIWDRLALAYRNYSNQLLLKTGRTGERLSIKHEIERTGKKPKWQSLESNLSGYDLLSVVDSNDSSPLLIEVKSSIAKLEYAQFHISRNEWKVAKTSENYTLHLWLIADQNQHFTVPIENLSKHIPNNNGAGEWESVIVPFSMVI